MIHSDFVSHSRVRTATGGQTNISLSAPVA
jgi:hypothetical protein